MNCHRPWSQGMKRRTGEGPPREIPEAPARPARHRGIPAEEIHALLDDLDEIQKIVNDRLEPMERRLNVQEHILAAKEKVLSLSADAIGCIELQEAPGPRSVRGPLQP